MKKRTHKFNLSKDGKLRKTFCFKVRLTQEEVETIERWQRETYGNDTEYATVKDFAISAFAEKKNRNHELEGEIVKLDAEELENES